MDRVKRNRKQKKITREIEKKGNKKERVKRKK